MERHRKGFWRGEGAPENQTLSLQPLPHFNRKSPVGQTVGLGSNEEKREQKNAEFFWRTAILRIGVGGKGQKYPKKGDTHRGRYGDGGERQTDRGRDTHTYTERTREIARKRQMTEREK